MMVNTILETADVDDELSALAAGHLDEIEREFEQCVAAAQSEGQLPGGRSPLQVARYLMTLNQGLRVACRGGSSRRELADVLETSLAVLQLSRA